MSKTLARRLDNPLIAEAYYEQIARRIIAGHNLASIAEALSIGKNAITRLIQKDEFKTVFRQVKSQLYARVDEALYDEATSIPERLELGAPRALTKLLEKMENARSERVQMEAAIHVLGLSGHTVVQKQLRAEIPIAELPEDQKNALAEALATALTDRVQSSKPLPLPTKSADVVDAILVDNLNAD